MITLIQLIILIPLIGFLISLLISKKNEKALARNAKWISLIQLASILVTLIIWGLNGFDAFNSKALVLFKNDSYEFFIDFYFDKITAVYLAVGSLLTFLIVSFSKVYMHREEGYKRFFSTILLFYAGYTITILSGNFETLFIGWEILGVSSYLLIAFYRERQLPSKNAIKIFSIYRIGDIGLILAMWLSHHLWHANVTFETIQNEALVHEHIVEHQILSILIGFAILLSALAKSAQLPFSNWLPRTMEGPTPSSAIFYGSLAVHMGAFLLLRTYPIWHEQWVLKVVIIVIGALTTLTASLTARVQSSIKSQIAYSSIAQIGLIFIEIALGLEWLALFHFAGNAFLRSYQLLISPSIVSYKLRNQLYNFKPIARTIEDSFPKKIEYTLYMLAQKEWNLDRLMNFLAWHPLRKLAMFFSFLKTNSILVIMLLLIITIGGLIEFKVLTSQNAGILPEVFATIGLVMVISSFYEKNNPIKSWFLVIFNHFWIAMAVFINDAFTQLDVLIYLSGVVAMGIVGFVCLKWLLMKQPNLNMIHFQGISQKFPKVAFVFFVASIGLFGFPITPTFIGEDLVFSHIQEEQILLAFLASLSFILDGIAIVKLYSKLFFGSYRENDNSIPYEFS